MTKEEKLTLKDWHQKNAVDLFNHSWTLIDKKKRTKEETDELIHAAHASRHHWGQIGKPGHFERGEWQISRVYSLLKMGESALYHAKRCLDICKANKLKDWDLAFAYESVARAYYVLKDKKNTEKYLKLASKAGLEIKESGDQDYFNTELKTIKLKAL